MTTISEPVRMPDSPLDRRMMLTGCVATLAGMASPAARAGRPKPRKPFEGTELADNSLAAKFEALPPSIHVPDTSFQTSDGPRRLSDLKNRATLVTLWAEFCAPCLMEMPDLARLRDRHRASGFDVVAIHLGGTSSSAMAKMTAVGASTVPCWNDADGKFAMAVATPPGASGFTLPCNLLVDRDGRVRGRAFGAQPLGTSGTPYQPLAAEEKRNLIHRRSAWSLPVADQFAQGLAGGLLSRI